MRGHDEQTTHMFSYLSPEQRVPADHPLRAVRALTDEALQTMSRRFASLYATTGRPSIPPEQWLRALLLQVLYTVRSERLLMEELTDNLLFRWFVGLNMDDPVWHPTTFTKNRDRLLSGDVAAAFFDAVQAHARAAGRLSDEHFTVDGTQLEAWASLKSFRCVDAAESDPPEDPGNPTVNFHGERRRNDTHQSTTDPEAMLYRKGKGKEAKLAYLGHVLLDNRQGLVANVCATHATGTAERDAAVRLLEASASPGSTVGADKGYDVARFVADVRVQDVTPHVAQKVRGSAIDGRTTRHAGYHVSQRKRKLVEQVFGWMKTVGGLRKLRHRGIALVDWQLTFAATAVEDHRRAAVRDLLPALRASVNARDLESPLQRMDRDLRLRTPHRRAARPADPSRPHPRAQRRQLPPRTQQEGPPPHGLPGALTPPPHDGAGCAHGFPLRLSPPQGRSQTPLQPVRTTALRHSAQRPGGLVFLRHRGLILLRP